MQLRNNSILLQLYIGLFSCEYIKKNDDNNNIAIEVYSLLIKTYCSINNSLIINNSSSTDEFNRVVETTSKKG